MQYTFAPKAIQRTVHPSREYCPLYLLIGTIFYRFSSATTSPSNRLIIRPAYPASCLECVTITMVVPSLWSSLKSSITSLPFLESRLPVGSSARISFGFATTARAIATRCCCPPESCWGKCLARCMMSIRFIASSTLFFRSDEGTPI